MEHPLQGGAVTIGILGLGYIGLPLAMAFGRQLKTIGFDLDATRVAELRRGVDRTGEVSEEELTTTTLLTFADDTKALKACNVYIVTVPTPIDAHNKPDLRPLEFATQIVASVLAQDDIVIYESTVYPGATEEFCAPILARISGLTLNQGFHLGYSPERINPGDRSHGLRDIVKVTAGSSPAAAEFVDQLYLQVITAGTHKAGSIRVAEAAKAIENTQRDLNIALVNELAIIFQRLGLDTNEVLDAAATKWNFIRFQPGLVGGHCIGVDPYYLTHKAVQVGYQPEVILAGRKLNDSMGVYVANRVIDTMTRRNIPTMGACVLIMGLAFKENCIDLRNTRVIDIVRELNQRQIEVDVYDPLVHPKQALTELRIELISELKPASYDAIVVAVAHDVFRAMGSADIRRLGRPKHVLFDVKSIFAIDESDERL